jgi:hypothetical protein
MLKADPLPWLLEMDTDNPGVRYFTLMRLLDLHPDEPEVIEARRAVMANGPVPEILAAQNPAGFWVKPGAGYSPKYRSTVWQIIFLAELGADPSDEQVQRGCEYLLNHSPASSGGFSVYNPPVPRGTLHCLNGNLIFALIRLGWVEDPRLQTALDWQARAITGEGQIEYHISGTEGPGFACGDNEGQPCGWGASKALRALLELSTGQQTPLIERGIQTGKEFLLSRDPSQADYPFSGRVSSHWFKLGFPLSYWSDVLETVSVLLDAGCKGDPRLENALQIILSKQDNQGRWKLENSLNNKMWTTIEKKGKQSKWITLRVLSVLKRAGLYYLNLSAAK